MCLLDSLPCTNFLLLILHLLLALNYLQARSGSQSADSSLSYESLERVRLRLSQSGPLAIAVSKLLDMLPSVTLTTQQEVIVSLDLVLRESLGFATRAAVADAVTALSRTCPKAFYCSGTSNSNPSVRLLRALYFASERERGQTASKMTTALGALAAHCPGGSVRILAMKACDKYNFSTGNNDDPASRRATAAVLRSIACRASNQLLDGGPNNVWFTKVLPVAFIGQKDSDTKTAGLWQEVWEEGSIVPCEDGFGTTLLEKLLPHLVKESCKALNSLAWSRRVAGSVALADLCAAGVLSPPPRQLVLSQADTYSVQRARRRAEASHKALNKSLQLLTGPRLFTGKGEVLKSAVLIASKWASASTDDSLSGEDVFGWEKTDEPCPWQPVLVEPENFNDLFVGDSWFRQTHETAECDPEDKLVLPLSDEAMDIDTSEAKGKLDIEEDDGDEGDIHESDVEEQIRLEARVVSFAGLARFLADQAMPSHVSRNVADSDEFLPYRVAAFKGLHDLIASLVDSSHKGDAMKRELYTRVSPKLVSLCDFDSRLVSEAATSKTKTEEAPVIVARAIDCLTVSFWHGIGWDGDIIKTGTSSVLELARFLVLFGKKQPAWTVREASWLCLASLASTCHQNALREHTLVSIFIEGAVDSFKDRKFWRVRFAGLNILHALVSRAGTRAFENDRSKSTEESDRQLRLEAILPQKDEIMKLARKALSDPEAKVTALSSDILGLVSWWP